MQRLTKFFTVLFILSILSVSAYAQTATVSTYEEFKAAAASEDVDEIIIASDIDTENTIEISGRPITIRAAEGTHPVINCVSTVGGTSILTYSDSSTKTSEPGFILDGLTFTGGTSIGLNIVMGENDLEIKNCTFRDIKNANNFGGAIMLTGLINVSADITNCAFINNSTVNHGGAIYFAAPLKANVTRCTFSGNSAKDAGAVHARFGAVVNIVNSTFTDNTASRNGGAIEITYGATVNMINCTFVNNKASRGAELFNDSTVNDNIFNAANSIFWNEKTAYFSSTQAINLYDCAYSANAFDTSAGGTLTSQDCIANLNWAGKDTNSHDVAGVTQIVFPLSKESNEDAALIDTGLTAEEIKSLLNLNWTPDLAFDQLNFERINNPDLGAMELFNAEGGNDADDNNNEDEGKGGDENGEGLLDNEDESPASNTILGDHSGGCDMGFGLLTVLACLAFVRKDR